MRDLDHDLAAMDAALARLERTIETARTDPKDVANVVALLSVIARAQRQVLAGIVEHVGRLTDDLDGRLREH